MWLLQEADKVAEHFLSEKKPQTEFFKTEFCRHCQALQNIDFFLFLILNCIISETKKKCR